VGGAGGMLGGGHGAIPLAVASRSCFTHHARLRGHAHPAHWDGVVCFLCVRLIFARAQAPPSLLATQSRCQSSQCAHSRRGACPCGTSYSPPNPPWRVLLGAAQRGAWKPRVDAAHRTRGLLLLLQPAYWRQSVGASPGVGLSNLVALLSGPQRGAWPGVVTPPLSGAGGACGRGRIAALRGRNTSAS